MRVMIVWAAIVAASLSLDAQTPAATNVDQSLQVEIARMDSQLFAAFNAGDLTRLKTFFAPDLEFYQDDEGLENYAQTMKDFQAMFRQPGPSSAATAALMTLAMVSAKHLPGTSGT